MNTYEKTDYSVYVLSEQEKLKFYGAGYLLCAAVGLLFYKSIIAGLIIGFAVLLFRKHYEGQLAEARRKMLTEEFRDLLYSLSSSMAAGYDVRKALSEGLDNLTELYDRDAPMVRELELIIGESTGGGASEAQLFSDFAERSGIEDVRSFAAIYIIARDAGGDMERIIGRATEILLDKLAVKREISMLMAQKKLEGRIITAMPIILILGLNMLSPGYLAGLYEGFAGRAVMTVALAGIVFSYFLMNKLTDIEI